MEPLVGSPSGFSSPPELLRSPVARFPSAQVVFRFKNGLSLNGGVTCGIALASAYGIGNCIGEKEISDPAFEFFPLRREKAMKSLWQEREGGALALASGVAVATIGVSLLLANPAMAESDISLLPQVYSVTSEHVMDDVGAYLKPREILELGAELRAQRLAQKDGATSLIMEGSKDLLRKAVQDPGDEEDDYLRTSLKVPIRISEDAQAGAGKTGVGELIPAGCPPSNLVAAAVVGSVASAVSVAGNTQHVVLFPGAAQLLARVVQHLGGGGLAGAVGATVVYPLDTIKTRLQAQSHKDGKYKDVLDCFRRLLSEEGLGSLYSGLVPQLLGIAPEKALKLTVNEIMLEILEQLLPGARLWALEFIAGGGGGFSQVLITNPMEIVKLRLQIQSNKLVPPKGLWEVVQELGLRGLYSGSVITLARDVPSSGIFFACYALITQLYPEQRFWAGFIAAIPATILVTPLDVIKTRLQMETPPGEEPYKNAWHCFRVLLQQEGVRGLFRGGLLRVLRTSPQFGITLMVYSFLCDGC